MQAHGRAGLAAAALAITGGCGSSEPPSATPGFFPRHYSGAAVFNAPLVKTAEVGRSVRSLRFHIDVPRRQAFTVAVRCDRGRFVTNLPGGIEGGPCPGSALTFTAAGCAGESMTLRVHVTARQSKSWGVALYTGTGVASDDCQRRTG